MVKVRVFSALLLSICVACNSVPEGDEMTATVMGARGLYTSPSQTAGAPPGSAVVADNVVVPRPGVYETRRGYSFLGARFPSGSITALTEFKGVLIGHGGGMLARYDATASKWVPYGYSAPTLGPVTHTVDAGCTDILPVPSVTGPVVIGTGSITIITQNDGVQQTFTWASTAGVENATPQRFDSAETSELVTGTGVRTGISVTWGDESYCSGDTYVFTVTGGTLPTTFLPPKGPIKDASGTLLTGRVRFHETGGCLYFTTSKGVFRLDEPTGKPYLSGISEGLLGTAALTGTSGFLTSGYSVAYRETWSRRTQDGRIIEGAPSGRVTVYNTLTASGTITFAGSSGTTTQTINGATAFSQSSGTDALRATALATAINTSVDPLIAGIVTASANAGVVTVSAVAYGTATNAITLAVTGTGVSRSGATLAGGGATRNVSRTIPIPKDLPPDAFLRVWRTEQFPNALGPGEDFAQVHEKALANIAPGATSYTFTDITPDAIRGDAAYFSANLGDGLLSSKYRPPLATDVLTFRDSTVYVGATGLQSTDLTLISVYNPFEYGLRLFFAGGYSELYQNTYASEGPFTFKTYTDGTPSQNIERTAMSIVRTINASSLRAKAAYTSSDNGTPGSFSITALALDEPEFSIQAWGSSIPFFPAMKVDAVAQSVSRASGIVTINTEGPHGLAVGNSVNITFSGNESIYPLGIKVVTSVPEADTFTYAEAGSNSVVVTDILYETVVEQLKTVVQGGPSFVAWSPLGEPDAVPVLQYVRVGKDENPVLGGLVLGNSLYLRKADGLYRLSGDTPAVFGLDQVDTTVSFIAPYAAFTLGGSAYALTTEGMKTWTEAGRPQVASVPVESSIRDIIVQDSEAVDSFAFAVNYESERTMMLWLPSTADSNRADFAYRFNYLTGAWTTESTKATCAIVSPTQDRMYVGTPDTGNILVERKDRLPTDFREADGSGVPAKVIFSPQLGEDPSTGKNFNRMKYHVDPDSPIPTEIDVSFSTDWVPAPTTHPILGANARGPTFETLVDREHKRGTRLYVGVSHDTPGEKLALLGYSVTFYEHQLGAT